MRERKRDIESVRKKVRASKRVRELDREREKLRDCE